MLIRCDLSIDFLDRGIWEPCGAHVEGINVRTRGTTCTPTRYTAEWWKDPAHGGPCPSNPQKMECDGFIDKRECAECKGHPRCAAIEREDGTPFYKAGQMCCPTEHKKHGLDYYVHCCDNTEAPTTSPSVKPSPSPSASPSVSPTAKGACSLFNEPPGDPPNPEMATCAEMYPHFGQCFHKHFWGDSDSARRDDVPKASLMCHTNDPLLFLTKDECEASLSCTGAGEGALTEAHCGVCRSDSTGLQVVKEMCGTCDMSESGARRRANQEETLPCKDDRRSRDETDVDCGGTECARCETGNFCAVNSDCVSNVCKTDTEAYQYYDCVNRGENLLTKPKSGEEYDNDEFSRLFGKCSNEDYLTRASCTAAEGATWIATESSSLCTTDEYNDECPAGGGGNQCKLRRLGKCVQSEAPTDAPTESPSSTPTQPTSPTNAPSAYPTDTISPTPEGDEVVEVDGEMTLASFTVDMRDDPDMDHAVKAAIAREVPGRTQSGDMRRTCVSAPAFGRRNA